MKTHLAAITVSEFVDRDSSQKLYSQVYNIFRGKIEKGEWVPYGQIPTENELCGICGVSKATVRIAVAELVKDGYLKKRQGKGTFVNPSLPDIDLAMKTRLTEDMFGAGVKTAKEIVVRVVKTPSREVQKHLRTDHEVHYILCRRVVDGEAAYLDETMLPVRFFPEISDADILRNSLYSLIQDKASLKIQKVVQSLEVTEISGSAAAMLNLPEGYPVLMLHRLLIGPNDVPITYTRLFGSGRKYIIQTEYERLK